MNLFGKPPEKQVEEKLLDLEQIQSDINANSLLHQTARAPETSLAMQDKIMTPRAGELFEDITSDINLANLSVFELYIVNELYDLIRQIYTTEFKGWMDWYERYGARDQHGQ